MSTSAELPRRALEVANRVRLARASLRRETLRLREPERKALVRDIIRTRPDCVQTMHVEEVVSWAFRGHYRWRDAREVVEEAGMGCGAKEVRTLTDRQASVLCEALER